MLLLIKWLAVNEHLKCNAKQCSMKYLTTMPLQPHASRRVGIADSLMLASRAFSANHRQMKTIRVIDTW